MVKTPQARKNISLAGFKRLWVEGLCLWTLQCLHRRNEQRFSRRPAWHGGNLARAGLPASSRCPNTPLPATRYIPGFLPDRTGFLRRKQQAFVCTKHLLCGAAEGERKPEPGGLGHRPAGPQAALCGLPTDDKCPESRGHAAGRARVAPGA